MIFRFTGSPSSLACASKTMRSRPSELACSLLLENWRQASTFLAVLPLLHFSLPVLSQYSLSSKPQLLPFDPFKACTQKYPITEYQPLYFVAESFKDAKEKVREYAATLKRPFSLIYNPYTQRIEVLDKKEKLARFANKIKSDVQILSDAIAGLQ